ncbi:MAG: SLBB domain-containing protein [Candidatus Delongbacteria bacterium]|nr:SLBB domain-containing protein [Candidatus Delongbacteria bacterium]
MFNRLILNVLFFLIISSGYIYAQDETFLETEMLKTQKEFQESGTSDTAIPQSELIKELTKPGNEHLLEQLRKMESENQIKSKIDSPEGKEKGTEGEKESLETADDDEKKIKISTSQELIMNDRYAYYESIKDFYGYEIFLNNILENEKSLQIPVNQDYVVGPGDELILSLWGNTEIQQRLVVSNEGTIFINGVGQVIVHDYTISDLEKRLKKVLSKNYITLDPPDGNPTTFFDISFSKIRSINIFVNGEVVNPGSYNLTPKSTILTSLIRAHGVTAKGTLRNIKVIRNGKIYSELDLYDYLLTGQNVNDVMLKDGDNVFVGPRLNTVSLEGEVLKPLKYELKENETLRDIIKYANGLLSTSSVDRVKIERIMPMEERTTPVVYSKILDLEFTYMENGILKVNPIKLHDRDVITVFSIPKILTEYVVMNGAVYRKGRYSFKDGMKLNDLIAKSGGLLADAFLDKIELIRTYPDMRTEYFNFSIADGKNLNFELNTLDSINIYSKWDLKRKSYVLVTGYIQKPGFTILSDSMRVSDLIFSRGGIEDDKQKKQTLLKRADVIRLNEDGLTTSIIPINLKKALAGDLQDDILLKDSDHLRIYDMNVVYEQSEVSISGFVKEEGTYPMSSNMTVEDLILTAKGFREGAYKYKAEVFRKNKNEGMISKVYDVVLSKDIFSSERNDKVQFFLMDKDHVVIRRDPDKENLKTVYISGQIKFPGLYSLIQNGETLRSLINRAGGLAEDSFIDGTEFLRDSTYIYSDFSKAISGSIKNDIVLKHGDKITIPSHPSTVSVEGFVYTPGLLSYRNDWSLYDYIEAAGGTRNELEYEVGQIVIYYPGGNAKTDGWFFSPSVKEGSKIVVNKIQKDNNIGLFRAEIKDWLTIIGSTVTIIYLLSGVN